MEYFILLVHNFYLALNLYLQNVCKWRVREASETLRSVQSRIAIYIVRMSRLPLDL